MSGEGSADTVEFEIDEALDGVSSRAFALVTLVVAAALEGAGAFLAEMPNRETEKSCQWCVVSKVHMEAEMKRTNEEIVRAPTSRHFALLGRAEQVEAPSRPWRLVFVRDAGKIFGRRPKHVLAPVAKTHAQCGLSRIGLAARQTGYRVLALEHARESRLPRRRRRSCGRRRCRRVHGRLFCLVALKELVEVVPALRKLGKASRETALLRIAESRIDGVARAS